MSSVQRYEALSDEQLLVVHNICDEFERSLYNDDCITVEHQIAAAPMELHAVLFRELLELELAARKTRGDQAEPSDYVARFPDRADEIQQVFAEIYGHDVDLPVPKQIGRYRINRLLGSGGFANVYLGYDEQLKRSVAIKVPRPELVSRRQHARDYLDEAQAVASLDHPHIVPVLDVGRTDEIPCYVVSKYIEGKDLGGILKKNRLSWRRAAEIVANIADALHHAHKRGLIHRDVKPANILLDSKRNAYLTDFGVALKDVATDGGPRFVGTPAYMSPEQSRGEGHRVDGRSDIYSLGAVLYELLTGRRTFSGKSRIELLEQIAHHEPKPPRQIEDSVPRELERICLKSLAKRARDRFTTALDMAQELRQFLDQCDSVANSSSVFSVQTSQRSGSGDRSVSTPADSDRLPLRIIPRGLRSFDEHDFDFFLELLPGPRNATGLPDNVGFWKTRIEEKDPDKTFQVGLIYGPSGCGKSSFVQAGLLPHLSDHITTIYVEATPDQTETRILEGLRKNYPKLDSDASLKESLAALRRGRLLGPGKKTLIVLDQFEQWLHATNEELSNPLVEALRQCDGERLQCILLVRDDFWLAISRFLRDVEIDLVQGKNIALVDLFDVKHARKVLAAFGRAYGRLPDDPEEMSQDENNFLSQVVKGLAVSGKIACVRLAVFAEMMKGRVWHPATLDEVGGTEGVGTTFLEETFSAPASNPRHRLHQNAARAVLRELLPESGIDIKGRMRSVNELRAVSNYSSRPRDFAELLRILDSEVRLITPIDPTGSEVQLGGSTVEPRSDKGEATRSSLPLHRLGDDGSVRSEGASDDQPTPPNHLYYQLTHDYIVHSLRDWLTRKQKETRRGRAELQLTERSDLWNRKHVNRNLPSVLEWATIRSLANQKRWTEQQRRMMKKADRFHLLRTSILAILLLVIGISANQFIGGVRHRALVGRIQTAVDTMSNSQGIIVPSAIEDLKEYPPELVLEELRSQTANSNQTQRLALSYAMAQFDTVDVDYLVSQIDKVASMETNNLADALARSKEDAIASIKQLANSSDVETNWPQKHRLAVVSLYMGDNSLAREMCELQSNGTERMKFIMGWEHWHGDLVTLSGHASSFVDPELRAGICAGIGQTPNEHLSEEVKRAWNPILSDWFQNTNDPNVHNSAGWLLRRWKMDLPEIAFSQALEGDRQWHVNGSGMTMVKLRPGSFFRRYGWLTKDAGSINFVRATLQEVVLTRAMLMSATEVTLGQYKQMRDDPDFPDSEKPTFDGRKRRFQYGDATQAPAENDPVQWVNWNDAVKFCNWLSHHEGFSPCYARTGHVWKIPTGEFEQWALVDGANGYRLPTEAEWEYACRAGATTQSPLVDDLNSLLLQVHSAELIPRVSANGYKVYRAETVGSMPPNGWGFFDMHGNVLEWCNDWYQQYHGLAEGNIEEKRTFEVDGPTRDPMGPERNDGQLHNVRRNGIFDRSKFPLSVGQSNCGFRVVRLIDP